MSDSIRQVAEEKAWEFGSQHYGESRSAFGFAWKVRQSAKAAGIDPMTIILLIQIAIKIWAWAKENGYLAIPATRPANAPQFNPDENADEDTIFGSL